MILDFLIEMFVDFTLLFMYAFIGFSIFMIFQLIAFQVFHKNPYKWIMKKLELI